MCRPFHLQVYAKNGKPMLHILGVPPQFITEPEIYRGHLASQRFVDTDSLPPKLSLPGFELLGVAGAHYENVRLQWAFRKIVSGTATAVLDPQSSNSDAKTSSSQSIMIDRGSSPSHQCSHIGRINGYELFYMAVKAYSTHWRGRQVLPVRKRKGIVSEKTPRIAREYPHSQRVRTGVYTDNSDSRGNEATQTISKASMSDDKEANVAAISTGLQEIGSTESSTTCPSSPPWLEQIEYPTNASNTLHEAAMLPQSESSELVNANCEIVQTISSKMPTIPRTHVSKIRECFLSRIPLPKRRPNSSESESSGPRKKRKIQMESPNKFSSRNHRIKAKCSLSDTLRNDFQRRLHRDYCKQSTSIAFKSGSIHSIRPQFARARSGKIKFTIRHQTLVPSSGSRSTFDFVERVRIEINPPLMLLQSPLFRSGTQLAAADKAADIVAKDMRTAESEIQMISQESFMAISRSAQKRDDTCHSNYHEILLKCPFRLSQLAMGHERLEDVTGREIIGMLLLAKQRGRLSGFKKVWSRRPVTGVTLKQILETSMGSECCPDRGEQTMIMSRMSLRNFSADNPPETNFETRPESNSDNITRTQSYPDSPSTDISPSPRPAVTRERYLGNNPKFSYYRATFAGRDLPILLVGYFHPEITTKRICCYGGTTKGERCFLSSWEYKPL